MPGQPGPGGGVQQPGMPGSSFGLRPSMGAPTQSGAYRTMQLLSCLVSRAHRRWHLIAHDCSSEQPPSAQAVSALSTMLSTMYEHAEFTAGVGQGMGQPGGVRPGMQPGPNGPMGGQAQGQAGQSMGIRPSFSGGLPPGHPLCSMCSLAITSTVIMACCSYPTCVASCRHSCTHIHLGHAQHGCIRLQQE